MINRQTWIPICSDGSIDEAELRRPVETTEPTTWEATLFDGTPHEFENGRVAAVFGVAAFEQRHGFRLTLADIGRATRWFLGPYRGEDCTTWCANEALYKLPWSVRGGIRLRLCRDWPLPNVTLTTAPIRTQVEASRVLQALLPMKAVRREVVFAPTEAIRAQSRIDRLKPESWKGNHVLGLGDLERAIHAVRVRGGETPMHPDWVRLLRDQAKGAGVPFSLAWGEWAPLREVSHSPGLAHAEMYCPFGREQGVFVRHLGCNTLDGVDYHED